MDLREIQALHARYADSPAVIDLPGQFARIPTPMLAAASQASAARTLGVGTWAKRSGIALAIVAAAGVVGTQAGHIWEHFHRSQVLMAAALKPHAVQSASVATTPPTSATPVADSTPAAKPLTARDFDAVDPTQPPTISQPKPAVTALAHVDGVRLAAPHPSAKPIVTDDDVAMRSPIIRRGASTAPSASTTVEPIAVKPVTTPTVAVTQENSASSPAVDHPVAHKWHPRGGSDAKATNIHAPAQATAGTISAKPTTAHAGGDVSLF